MALGDGEVYYGSLPDNNTSISDGDDYILHNSKFVQVRQNKEHVWPSTQPASATAGYHRHITLQPYASGTTPATFVVNTTAGAIGFCSSGTGQALYVAIGTTDVRLFNDDATLNSSLLGVASQTKGDVVITTAGGVGLSRLPLGTTGQMLVVSATTGPMWSNTVSATSTFSEAVVFAKTITVATGVTIGTISCTGTSTLTGNVVMAASASVGGALAVTGALTAGGDAIPKFKLGSYAGNGASGRGITGVGFQPTWLFIYKAGSSYGEFIKATGDAGCKMVGSNNYFTTSGIMSLDADGFTITANGGVNDVNETGFTFYYLALG